MMDAVAEPDSFDVAIEGCPVAACAFSGERAVDVFEGAADCKVFLAVLVPDNIASGSDGFGEVVEEFFFLEGEFFEAGDLVPEDTDISYAFGEVFEVIGGGSGKDWTTHEGPGHEWQQQVSFDRHKVVSCVVRAR